MHSKSLWVAGLAALLLGPSWAEGEEKIALAETNDAPVVAEKTKEETAPVVDEKVKDPKLRKHLVENIDIFGKSEMPAIYILAPGLEEYEGFLLTRDFSRDPFFMQNIDREEFEMKTYMREFSDDLDKDKKKDAATR